MQRLQYCAALMALLAISSSAVAIERRTPAAETEKRRDSREVPASADVSPPSRSREELLKENVVVKDEEIQSRITRGEDLESLYNEILAP